MQKFALESAPGVHAGDNPPALRAVREPPLLHFPDEVADEPVVPPAFIADEVRPPQRSRRMLYLGVAALTLIVGGVGVTLVARGGVKMGGPAPTILAATGPVKVQPANPGGADLPNQSSSVLDKGQADPVGSSRVVSRQEQPVDLAQAARTAPPRDGDSAAGATPPAPSTAANGFPEPKRVKTVSVRPDGTIIADGAAAMPPPAPILPAVPAAPTRSIASIPLNPSSARPIAPSAPATPSTQAAAPTPPTPAAPAAKPPTTPAAPKATTRIASATPAGQMDDAAKPKPATPAKPVAAKPASSGGGGFAVQLAAPPSEQEAKETMARLQKKYAGELGAHRPSVVKAAVGDKAVYRVRVGGLSKEDADSLCGSIKSGGGACFVAKN